MAVGTSVGATLTLIGTPSYSVVAAADALGNISFPNGFTTFAGTGATGQRYSATLNAVINTTGGGSTFFPGNSGGTTSTGGQYV